MRTALLLAALLTAAGCAEPEPPDVTLDGVAPVQTDGDLAPDAGLRPDATLDPETDLAPDATAAPPADTLQP